MVVGASPVAGRGAVGGLGGVTVRVRTVLSSPPGLSPSPSTVGAAATGADTGSGVGATGAGAGASTTGSASTGAGVASVVFAFPLPLLGSSGATSRRMPSWSTLRRIRSACASSIEAEGLEAPTPNDEATSSNSLLVRPSSLLSSCTRIFFCAKTILNLSAGNASTVLYSFTTSARTTSWWKVCHATTCDASNVERRARWA
jgi:hypothetical protein